MNNPLCFDGTHFKENINIQNDYANGTFLEVILHQSIEGIFYEIRSTRLKNER